MVCFSEHFFYLLLVCLLVCLLACLLGYLSLVTTHSSPSVLQATKCISFSAFSRGNAK